MPLTPSKDKDYMPPEEVMLTAFDTTYQSQITYSVEALKLLGLANGGAAVGLLTFMGNKTKPVSGLESAIFLFALGAGASVLAFFACYFCQMYIMKYWASNDTKWKARHQWGFGAVLFLISIGILSFIVGAVCAAQKLGA